MLYNFNQLTVPLEHIDSVKNIECPEDGVITFSFDQPNLFRQAQNSWPKNGDDFVLIDNTDGCGKSAHRTFFYVDEYTMDEKTHSVRAKGEMFDSTEARIIQSYTANFGYNRAPNPHTPQAGKLKQRFWEPAKSAIQRRWGINPIDDITSAAGEVKTAAAPIVSSAKAGVSNAVAAVSTKAGGVVSAAETKASQVEAGASHLVQGAKTEAQHIASKASNVAEDVVSHLPTAAVHKDFEDNVDHEADKNDDSPWGKADRIGSVKGMTVYCVECRMKGKLSMTGSITFHLGEKLFKEGYVDVHLENFAVPMIFGFEAKHFNTPKIPIPLHKGIFALPLQPFSIPNEFVVGPQIDYEVQLQIALSATGNLKTGLTMTWKDAKAHLDLMDDNDKTGGSGWTPEVEKTFEMSDGQLSINTSIATPIGIAAGINILDGKYTLLAGVYDSPAIELDTIMDFEGNTKRDYSYNDRSHARELLPRELQIRKDDEQCKDGIREKVSFVDRVYLDVFKVYKHYFTTYSKSIWETCIHTGASNKLGHDATKLPAITGPGPTAPSLGASIPHPSGAFPKFSSNGTAGAGTGIAPTTTKPPSTSK